MVQKLGESYARKHAANIFLTQGISSENPWRFRSFKEIP